MPNFQENGAVASGKVIDDSFTLSDRVVFLAGHGIGDSFALTEGLVITNV